MLDDAYLARQSIVDRQNVLWGYELLYRKDRLAQASNIISDLDASSKVLLNALCHFGTKSLLTGKLAFINVGYATLQSDFLALLEPLSNQIILEIQLEEDYPAIIDEKIAALIQQGFKIAVPAEAIQPSYSDLLLKAAYLKLDIQKLGLTLSKQLVESAQKKASLTIIAEKIETAKELEACRQFGAVYFQGYFFAKPETLAKKIISVSTLSTNKILAQIQVQEPLDALIASFKKDPALSLQLFQYLGSIEPQGRKVPYSLGQAIDAMGVARLKQLLHLIALCAPHDRVKDPSGHDLHWQIAEVQCRVLEILGQTLKTSAKNAYLADHLFLLGLIVNAAKLLGVQPQELAKEMSLPVEVLQSLTMEQGPYTNYLLFSNAWVRQENNEIVRLTKLLQLPETTTQNLPIPH